jgi:hypothetical protein
MIATTQLVYRPAVGAGFFKKIPLEPASAYGWAVNAIAYNQGRSTGCLTLGGAKMGELVNSFRKLGSAHFRYARAVKRLLNGIGVKTKNAVQRNVDAVLSQAGCLQVFAIARTTLIQRLLSDRANAF